eukprot:6746750-Prymnesium_polylepis.1
MVAAASGRLAAAALRALLDGMPDGTSRAAAQLLLSALIAHHDCVIAIVIADRMQAVPSDPVSEAR